MFFVALMSPLHKITFYLDLLLNESDPLVSKVVQQLGFVVPYLCIREVSTYTI